MMHNLLARIGPRGLLLLTFSIPILIYGVALLLGFHSSLSEDLNIPDQVFGIGFVVTGVICTIGAYTSRLGKFPYVLAVSVICFKVGITLTFWNKPLGWAASMPWVGLLLVQLIALLWDDIISHRKKFYDLDSTDPALRAIKYTDEVKKRTVASEYSRERKTR